MSINRVELVGNLTRDPELRRTQSGTAVLNIGIAVNNRRKNSQTGEWEDDPCFVDCVMFGSRAEHVSGHLAKGQKIAIDGKLRWSQWQTNDGQKRSKLEVVVDDLDFMSQRQDGGQGNQGGFRYGSSGSTDTQYVDADVIDGTFEYRW